MITYPEVRSAIQETLVEKESLQKNIYLLQQKGEELKVQEDFFSPPVKKFLQRSLQLDKEQALAGTVLKFTTDFLKSLEGLIRRWDQVAGNLRLLQTQGKEISWRLLKAFYEEMMLLRSKNQKILSAIQQKTLLTGTYAAYLNLEQELKPVQKWLKDKKIKKEEVKFSQKAEELRKELEFFTRGLIDICRSSQKKIEQLPKIRNH